MMPHFLISLPLQQSSYKDGESLVYIFLLQRGCLIICQSSGLQCCCIKPCCFLFLFFFFFLFCYLVPGPCDPEDLLDGVVFGAKYLGSTQIKSEKNPSTNARMAQAQEAVNRIKVETPEMPSRGFHTMIMPKIMRGMRMMWSDVLVTDFSSRLPRESRSQWPKWICSSQRSELKC